MKCVTYIVDEFGAYLHVSDRCGIAFALQKIIKRPVLIVGILILLVASIYFSSHILFVEVEGNHILSDRQIIDSASDFGVYFGASRRMVRSEKIKNALLEHLPQLQWAGINTRGCVAVITVQERESEKERGDLTPVSHIVADCDGVIYSMIISKGTALCKVGQVVKKGQFLVSGYTNCDLAIKAQRAAAEIFAKTNRTLDTILPSTYCFRGNILFRECRYSIILGKKQIKLWKGSGISGTTCVKMYKQKYVTLPGGFVLPVGLHAEYLVYCDTPVFGKIDTQPSAWLMDWSENYLRNHMICGQILDATKTITEINGVFQLTTNYQCIEMIGRNLDEELLENHGKEH